MIPLIIGIQPISAKAFAPYGDLLETPKAGQRQDFAARIENFRPTAQANLALIRSEPFVGGTVLGTLERHRFSTQLFAPLDVESYLVVVARHGQPQGPDLASLKAFQVAGHQAISYHSGIWHAAMATLKRPGIFAMLVHEDGSSADCEYVELGKPVLITGV